jgi:hypothetical protein
MYVDLHPDVSGYLERRHLNIAMQTEIPPQCAVTTGLLIALHHTAHGKNDVLDRVIEMDEHPWMSVPTCSSGEEEAAAMKRHRGILCGRITDTLSKVVGSQAKDRARMLMSNKPEDISRCLNRLLKERYVPMPTIQKKRYVRMPTKHDILSVC